VVWSTFLLIETVHTVEVDLADSIVDFKAKRLPISYTEKVRKVPSKISKRVINFLTSLIVIAIVATSVFLL